MEVDEQLRSLIDVFGFAVVEADGGNRSVVCGLSHSDDVGGCLYLLEECVSDFVDLDVGGLGGHHHSDE